MDGGPHVCRRWQHLVAALVRAELSELPDRTPSAIAGALRASSAAPAQGADGIQLHANRSFQPSLDLGQAADAD